MCHCECVSVWISSRQTLLCAPTTTLRAPFLSEHPTTARTVGPVWNELPGEIAAPRQLAVWTWTRSRRPGVGVSGGGGGGGGCVRRV